jgi:hypothetical protein
MSKRKQRRQSSSTRGGKRTDRESGDDQDHSGTEKDYADIADAYAQQDDDDDQEGNDNDNGGNILEENNSDDEHDDDDDDEGDVAAALFQGANQLDEEVADDGEDSSGEEEIASKAWIQSNNNHTSTTAQSSEPFAFDLRNMLAVSTDQLATSSLYNNNNNNDDNNNIISSSSNKKSATISIPLADSGLAVNEEILLQTATNGCTQLIRALWQLPTEQSDAGPLVTLPSYNEIRLPRALVRIDERDYCLLFVCRWLVPMTII